MNPSDAGQPGAPAAGAPVTGGAPATQASTVGGNVGGTQGTGVANNADVQKIAQDAKSAVQSDMQKAHDFLNGLLDDTGNFASNEVQNVEKAVVSVALDFVPPTYRGVVQPFVDGIVNNVAGKANAQITSDIAKGIAWAKARIAAIL